MDFWLASRNLSSEKRKLLVRISVGVSSVLVALIIFLMGTYARVTVPAESPIWEIALQLRLILVRLFVAVGLIPLGVFLAIVAHSAFSKTEKARRLWTWATNDTAIVKAQKTQNAGNFLNALIVACVLGLLLGVLR